MWLSTPLTPTLSPRGERVTMEACATEFNRFQFYAHNRVGEGG